MKQKPDRTEERNRKFNNYDWELQYPISIMDRTTRQNLDKEIKNLNNIIDKLEITNFYKILFKIYILLKST